MKYLWNLLVSHIILALVITYFCLLFKFLIGPIDVKVVKYLSIIFEVYTTTMVIAITLVDNRIFFEDLYEYVKQGIKK